MNKRDFLKSALAAAVVPMIKSEAKPEAAPEPFEPDIELENGHPICWHITGLFIDGEKLDIGNCYAAYVSYRSFEKPTMGEVIVNATRPGFEMISTYTHKPEPGEFGWKDTPHLVKTRSGAVLINLSDEGKRILVHIKEMEVERG